jgi:hypothetical protein
VVFHILERFQLVLDLIKIQISTKYGMDKVLIEPGFFLKKVSCQCKIPDFSKNSSKITSVLTSDLSLVRTPSQMSELNHLQLPK